MAEYIEREAAMLTPVLPKEYRQYQTDNLDDAYEQGWEDALNNLKNAPAADVAPVVHGRWIQKKEWHLGRWVAWFECSECGTHDDNADMYNAMPFCNLTNYCPECGAKMDEVSK